MKKLLFLIVFIGSTFGYMAQTLRVVTKDLPPYQIAVEGKVLTRSSFLAVEEV